MPRCLDWSARYATHITLEMVRRVAKAGADGRVLAVNTTNLDEDTSRVFDLVASALSFAYVKEYGPVIIMSIIDSDLEIKSRDARCFRFRNRIISEIMGEVTVRGDQITE